MKTAIVIMSIWAIIGPIWAILFARKNPKISGWIAAKAIAAKEAAEAKAADLEKQVAALKVKLNSGN